MATTTYRQHAQWNQHDARRQDLRIPGHARITHREVERKDFNQFDRIAESAFHGLEVDRVAIGYASNDG